ncbi:MAG TPA: glycosyltransferase family 4 protein [Pyrinomonadaceae bacterium]
MKRLRLLFVVESGSDVRLVEGLAERFELSVFARRIEGGAEISQPTAATFRMETGPAARSGFARAAFGEVRRRRAELDAVVVQGYGAAALAANTACRLAGLPAFMLVCSPSERYYLCRRQHAEPSKPFRRRELLALGALARLNARVGAHYLVLSDHLAEVVRGHGGRRPVTVVPVYGVDTEIFSPAREPKEVTRERLGLHAGGSLVFFSSRVAPEKDAGTLLRAFRMLLEEGRDLRLLHRSGGHRAFAEEARRFGVGERVVATDAVHPHRGLADDYRASNLCVQASREEGLGFSPLEALACGVPVVAARVGGLRETIVEGETGWGYAVGDAQDLARSIRAALDDPAEAARRAALGREMVCARFDRRSAFKQFEEVIGSALGMCGEGSAEQSERVDASRRRGQLREEADSPS